MSDEITGGKLLLTQRAEEIIDEETTAVELVSQLDVHEYAIEDPYPDWHDSAPFEPMFKAILLRELEDYSDPELSRLLEDDPGVAQALGFDPDNLPSRSTFTRARNGRFDPFRSEIETSVRQIRTLAANCASSIGPSFAPEDRSGTSRRTKQRILRSKTRDVVEEMEDVAFPPIDLHRPDDPIYDEDDLLSFETLICVKQLAANDGGDEYADSADPECDLGPDDPFYAEGPTGETLLESIKNLDPAAISEMVNRAAARILIRVKPYVEFQTPVFLALDLTYVAYYGDRDEMVKVQGAPADKEYDWCHKFATAAIVGENVHFTVAMLPVGNAHYHDPDDYPGKDRTYRMGEVVRNLLDIADEHVTVRCVYADREFYGGDTVAALEEYNMTYVIPAPLTDVVKSFVRDMDSQVTVKDVHAFHSTVKGGVTNERVTTTLVGLPADEDHDSPQPFITNSEVDDEIGLDRRRTKRKIKRYNKRGGIETAYKKIKEFAAWTTSRAYEVRLFHFGFAVLLYNMWLVVDFLVQVSLDIVEFRPKPRVTAAQFRRHLKRRLDKLI